MMIGLCIAGYLLTVLIALFVFASVIFELIWPVFLLILGHGPWSTSRSVWQTGMRASTMRNTNTNTDKDLMR